MALIHVKGRKIEIPEYLIAESDPSGNHDGNFYVEGSWFDLPSEYNAAKSSVESALTALFDLEDTVLVPGAGKDIIGDCVAKISGYSSFRATYTSSAEAWGQGEDHADQRLADAERTYDLGSVVRDMAMSLLDLYGSRV